MTTQCYDTIIRSSALGGGIGNTPICFPDDRRIGLYFNLNFLGVITIRLYSDNNPNSPNWFRYDLGSGGVVKLLCCDYGPLLKGPIFLGPGPVTPAQLTVELLTI
jgi:hypothetical protein